MIVSATPNCVALTPTRAIPAALAPAQRPALRPKAPKAAATARRGEAARGSAIMDGLVARLGVDARHKAGHDGGMSGRARLLFPVEFSKIRRRAALGLAAG